MDECRDSRDQSGQALGAEAENRGEHVGLLSEGRNLVPVGFWRQNNKN